MVSSDNPLVFPHSYSKPSLVHVVAIVQLSFFIVVFFLKSLKPFFKTCNIIRFLLIDVQGFLLLLEILKKLFEKLSWPFSACIGRWFGIVKMTLTKDSGCAIEKHEMFSWYSQVI